MINLKEKQKIISQAILKGKIPRQIAREMKTSRTTVAKYLNDYERSKSKLMEPQAALSSRKKEFVNQKILQNF